MGNRGNFCIPNIENMILRRKGICNWLSLVFTLRRRNLNCPGIKNNYSKSLTDRIRVRIEHSNCKASRFCPFNCCHHATHM